MGRQVILGHACFFSGSVFANPTASSSAPCPQESNPWSSHILEQIHSSQAGKSENQTPVRIRDASPEFSHPQ